MQIHCRQYPLFMFIAMISCISFAGCNCENDNPNALNEEYVQLGFTPAFTDISLESRAGARLIDSKFSDGKIYNFGIWLCNQIENDTNDNYVPISNDMFNFKGEYAPVTGIEAYDSWRFIFDNFNHKHIGFRRGSELRVFACYPHIEGTHDPAHVPFSIQTQEDALWCDPINLRNTDNSANNINEELNCHHIYACIEIVISLNNAANITLSSVTLTDKEERLITNGTYDSTSGEIAVPKNYDQSFTLSNLGMVFNPSKDEYTNQSLYILIPPIDDYYDGRYSLDFIIDGVKKTFPMPVINDLTEFKASTRYIYKLSIDNVMTFTASGVDNSGWKTITVDDIEI